MTEPPDDRDRPATEPPSPAATDDAPMAAGPGGTRMQGRDRPARGAATPLGVRPSRSATPADRPWSQPGWVRPAAALVRAALRRPGHRSSCCLRGRPRVRSAASSSPRSSACSALTGPDQPAGVVLTLAWAACSSWSSGSCCVAGPGPDDRRADRRARRGDPSGRRGRLLGAGRAGRGARPASCASWRRASTR